MAKPFYIICSQSSADDKLSGRISFFDVIERILFTKNAIPQGVMPLQQMRVTAAWHHEPQDAGKNFEWSVIIRFPTSDADEQIANGILQFQGPSQRIIATLVGMPIAGPGTLKIQSRIRPEGDEEWISQEYSIVVEEFIDPAITSTVPPAALKYFKSPN
jgi:hypothetical protein